MKRDKKWWSGLSKKERRELFYLQTAPSLSGSSYLPDDCGECGNCRNPHLGVGLCSPCLDRLVELEDKANKINKV